MFEKNSEVLKYIADNNSLYSIAIIDLDFFSRICMRLCEEDIQILKGKIENFIRDSLPSKAILCSSENDEYLIISVDKTKEELVSYIEILKKTFRRQKFMSHCCAEYSNIFLRFSAGISSYDEDGNCFHEVLKKAFVALFLAKAHRRNKVMKAPSSKLESNYTLHYYNPDAEVFLYAGQYGEIGYVDDEMKLEEARFWEPQAIAVAEEALYIADQNNNCVLVSKDGIVKRLIGSSKGGYAGDGKCGKEALLNRPTGLTVNKNKLFITDTGNDVVRVYDILNDSIDTYAGNGVAGYSGDLGNARYASLNKCGGICADIVGNVYINDIVNNCIRKVDRDGIITTYAGNGSYGYFGDGGLALNASFSEIYNLCCGQEEGELFLADYFNHCIRHIDGRTGIITTIAGNGTEGYSGDGGDPLKAQLSKPVAVCQDKHGNIIFAESGNNCVRILMKGNSKIYTLIGDGVCGIGNSRTVKGFRLANPNGLAITSSQRLYVLDGACNRILYMELSKILYNGGIVLWM